MKSKLGLLALFLIFFTSCQTISHWIGTDEVVLDKVFSPEKASSIPPDKPLTYHLLTYKTKDPQKRFPLLVVLHGGGGNGRDTLESWRDWANWKNFMVLAPTYGDQGYDIDAKDFLPLIQEVVKQYPVDQDRVFLIGSSAGAYAARVLVSENPSFWRGAVFLSTPFYEKEEGQKFDQFPPLLFIHGQKDIYKVETIIENVKLLRGHGVKVDLIVDPEAGHGLGSEWNEAIFKWIQKTEKRA